jgi:hypothetical protein
MSYASGGLIQAADYNALVGSNSTTAGTLNYIWSTGNGAYGYGQSAIATVSAGSTVAAVNWSNMLTALNGALGHQSGSGAQLPSAALNYTSGSTITYFSNVNTAITSTIQTNYASFNSTQGSTTTGAGFTATINVGTGVAYSGYLATRSVTFTSGDAARYFFNAGGQLNYVISSVTINAADSRATDAQTLIATNLGGFSTFRNITGGGRTGSGGTVNTNSTTIGYRQLTTAQQTLVDVTSSTSPYTTDNANLRVRSNGVQGSNGDLGSVIYFDLGCNFPAHAGFNDALNVTVNHRIDIVAPESTYLAAWTLPTIA